MNREEIKAPLLSIRQMMDASGLGNDAGYTLGGEIRSVVVDGKNHRVRFYPAGDEVAPLYIDIHGGGMCWGNMEDTDPLAKMLNEQLHVHVLSPEYPLSPENQYPVQPEYVYGTIREVIRHADEWKIDPSRVIVGGCSAGANLATVMTMLAAEKGELRFVGQVLDHPWLDLDHRIPWSERVAGSGAFTEMNMEALAVAYADPEERKLPQCTPLNADQEMLSKLPSAIIQTCELDPLRPEGDLYAELLRNAGVSVVWHCYPGAEHGFSQQISEPGQDGRQWILDQIREQKWISD